MMVLRGKLIVPSMQNQTSDYEKLLINALWEKSGLIFMKAFA
jgi:hypothetical protein